MFMVTPAGREWLLERYPGDVRRVSRRRHRDRRLHALSSASTASCSDSSPSADDARSATRRCRTITPDPEYDEPDHRSSRALHERADRPLQEFAALEPRFREYVRRLDVAYDRTLAGEHDFVSGAKVDSYHTVWFELHEDLVADPGP